MLPQGWKHGTDPAMSSLYGDAQNKAVPARRDRAPYRPPPTAKPRDKADK